MIKNIFYILLFTSMLIAKEKSSMKEIYNKSGKKESCFIDGSFIYWKARSRGSNLGSHIQREETLTRTYFLDMDFDYHPGFKVGLGKKIKRDNWRFYLEYTHYFARDENQKDIRANFDLINNFLEVSSGKDWVGPIPLDIGIRGAYIKQTWKVFLDSLDALIGRFFYVSKKLNFTSYSGLKGGWITQKINSDRIQDAGVILVKVFHKFESKSWFLGPKIGLDMKWNIKKGWKLFGNFAANLLYQNFKNSINYEIPKQEDVPNSATNGMKREEIHKVNPNFEVYCGAGWGITFCKNKNIDFSLGYEFCFFKGQYVKAHLEDDHQPYQNHLRDLTFNGLTFVLKLGF